MSKGSVKSAQGSAFVTTTDLYTIKRLEDDHCAVLVQKGGTIIRLPIEWLPNRAEKGAELVVHVSANVDGARIDIELAKPSSMEKAIDLEG